MRLLSFPRVWPLIFDIIIGMSNAQRRDKAKERQKERKERDSVVRKSLIFLQLNGEQSYQFSRFFLSDPTYDGH